MTSVEVQSPPLPSVEVQSPPLPPDGEGDSTKGGPTTCEPGPSSTYEWLASVPVLSSAGSTVYGWYEGSKNYTRASKYALDSVESSVKYVAGTAATVVKRPSKCIKYACVSFSLEGVVFVCCVEFVRLSLSRLVTAVDSFAVKQLVKLEEKVPAIKTETGDVLEALGEQKTAVCSRFSSGKDAITTRLVTGKEAVTTTIQGGKDTLVGYLHAGSEAIANTRPGCLVGSGVNRTLQVTENIVDYLLPEQEEEKERASVDAEEKEVKVEEKVTSEVKGESNGEEVDGEGEEEEEEEAKGGESKVTRVKNLSRKVKLHVYYRTLRRLDTVQQQCKSTLEQLKMNLDLVSMVTFSNLWSYMYMYMYMCMVHVYYPCSCILIVLYTQTNVNLYI